MSLLHLDFETRSNLDLKLLGLHNYARGRETDILCACYAFDDEPVELWLPFRPLSKRFTDHIEFGGEVWAHNAAFELEICNSVATRRYGWPHIYTDQLHCTMALAYAMALPGNLAGAAAALGVDQQKDLAGGRLMLQYCQPRSVSRDGMIIWWDNPDDLKKIYDYCKQDVVVERAIGKRLLRLSPYERKVWELDQKINSRGITLDVKAAFQALIICEQEKQRLIKEIQSVSGNAVATPSAVAQIKTYLAAQLGKDIDSLAKQDVVDLLGQVDLPEDCRKILEIRQEASKTSTAKLDPMLQGAGPDNRIRGTFQYSGANTRRWAGRRIQLQNLPRPKHPTQTITAILEGLHNATTSADQMDILYGRPLALISDCLRGLLVSGRGCDFTFCDFSAIEARVIAWLAGEERVLEIFRTHGKIYEDAAAKIFGISVEEVTDAQRQVGKVAVLALGYQGGVGAFRAMAKGYGVTLAAAYESLWALADFEQREWVERRFESEHEKYAPISREEFIAADLTKMFWRKANPAIVNLWNQLERAAIAAVEHPGQAVTSGIIVYRTKGSFLWCRLPSGGVLSYPYPQIREMKTPWGEKKMGLTYMSEDGQSRKWLRFKTYGGALAENVTQAVARDLLADAMLRLEARQYTIVGHVHDEIICETKEGWGSIAEMIEIMCERPEWAKDLPIRASGKRDNRYQK